jgi:predicted transcriptional regulator
MKTAKEELHQLIDDLPDDVSLESALYDLQFKAKVLRGIEQVERGEVVGQDEARKRLARWLESPGR